MPAAARSIASAVMHGGRVLRRAPRRRPCAHARGGAALRSLRSSRVAPRRVAAQRSLTVAAFPALRSLSAGAWRVLPAIVRVAPAVCLMATITRARPTSNQRPKPESGANRHQVKPAQAQESKADRHESKPERLRERLSRQVPRHEKTVARHPQSRIRTETPFSAPPRPGAG